MIVHVVISPNNFRIKFFRFGKIYCPTPLSEPFTLILNILLKFLVKKLKFLYPVSKV